MPRQPTLSIEHELTQCRLYEIEPAKTSAPDAVTLSVHGGGFAVVGGVAAAELFTSSPDMATAATFNPMPIGTRQAEA